MHAVQPSWVREQHLVVDTVVFVDVSGNVQRFSVALFCPCVFKVFVSRMQICVLLPEGQCATVATAGREVEQKSVTALNTAVDTQPWTHEVCPLQHEASVLNCDELTESCLLATLNARENFAS